MNFVACVVRIARESKLRVSNNLFLILLLSICLAGCNDHVRLPSVEKLVEFENAGPPRPVVDVDRLVRAKVGGGPYRVVPGDVLELTMPAILQVVTAEESDVSTVTAPYVCRVGNEGKITLPVVGEIEVGGKSLSQVESAVVDAYYPDYTVTMPSVFARVLEYETAEVSITGAVQKPGIYSLRNDQMSLVALLMEAGGIVEKGAAFIRIIRTPEATQNEDRPSRPVPSTTGNNASRAEADSTIVRAAGGLPTSEQAEEILLGPRSVGSEQMAVQLMFRQLSNSAKGVLSVFFDGKTREITNVDINNGLHRRTIVRYLGQKDQRFSTVGLESELNSLAEEFQTAIRLKSELAGLRKELQAVSALDSAKATSEKADLIGETGKDKTEPEQDSMSDEAIYRQLAGSLSSRPNTGYRDAPGGRANKPEPLVLPVKGLNIPFADVALQDGDAVIVEQVEPPLVTVVGLVIRPGNFPYPPTAQYNLIQALGFAGGFDATAEPRYVTVYRMKPDGTIVNVTLKLVDGSKMTDALNIAIKPGDIIAVEHTPRTRKNVFLERVFRINFGVYVPLSDLWGSSNAR